MTREMNMVKCGMFSKGVDSTPEGSEHCPVPSRAPGLVYSLPSGRDKRKPFLLNDLQRFRGGACQCLCEPRTGSSTPRSLCVSCPPFAALAPPSCTISMPRCHTLLHMLQFQGSLLGQLPALDHVGHQRYLDGFQLPSSSVITLICEWVLLWARATFLAHPQGPACLLPPIPPSSRHDRETWRSLAPGPEQPCTPGNKH